MKGVGVRTGRVTRPGLIVGAGRPRWVGRWEMPLRVTSSPAKGRGGDGRGGDRWAEEAGKNECPSGSPSIDS
jgi:hypothetical protein